MFLKIYFWRRLLFNGLVEIFLFTLIFRQTVLNSSLFSDFEITVKPPRRLRILHLTFFFSPDTGSTQALFPFLAFWGVGCELEKTKQKDIQARKHMRRHRRFFDKLSHMRAAIKIFIIGSIRLSVKGFMHTCP